MTMTQNLKNENHYKDFHKNVTFLYIFFFYKLMNKR